MASGDAQPAAAGRPEPIEVGAIPASLDALLADRARTHADAVLLDYFEDGRTYTYAEFAKLVDAATARLAAAGVGVGDRVAVLLPNIPLFPVLTFALARAGAVCVPVNTRYTAAELDLVCADAGVRLLIIDDDLRAGVGDAEVLRLLPAANVLRPEPGGAALAGPPAAERQAPQAPALDRPTHIQYTSGTTGLPKGCLLSQRYWLTAAAAYGAVRRGAGRSLEDSPYFYMSGPLLLISTLFAGGTVVVARTATLRNFLRRIAEQRIDWCWFPQQLLMLPPGELDRAHGLTSASVYLAGPDEVEAIRERFGVVVTDGWSMTETGFGTWVPEDRPEIMRAGSIGIPMPLREFKIVDEELRELPDGAIGELCVRGPGMFLGYHNRPDADRELIVDGWFRTGDRASRDERGWLFYHGRAKDMVRRSGENIACAEVESAIRQIPQVYDCAVVPVPDAWREEEVKVYVVLHDEVTPDDLPPARIAEWARRRLAAFKVPRYIEYRDDLPYTPSGKVAKGELTHEKPDLRLGSFDRVDDVWR